MCAGSRSQNTLNTLNTTASDCSSLKKLTGIAADTRSFEEILADELPTPEDLDAMEKAAIRFHTHKIFHLNLPAGASHLFGQNVGKCHCACLCLQAALSGETAGQRRSVRVRPEEEPGVRSPGPGVSVRGANQVRTFPLQHCGVPTYISTVWIFVLLPLSLCLGAGRWSTQRTSCVTSSRTRCRRRSVSGWPPPSHARRCCRCTAARTSRASGALCTPCRPASLWRGRGWFLSSLCRISTVHTETTGLWHCVLFSSGRMYRQASNTAGLNYPANVITELKVVNGSRVQQPDVFVSPPAVLFGFFFSMWTLGRSTCSR